MPSRPLSGARSVPWLGSHLSISGGMHHALEAAGALQCDCVQVFTKNQRQWRVKPLRDEDVAAWKAAIEDLGWAGDPARVVSHNSYLVNMASPDPEGWEKSVALQRE
ncbi:MAG: TIM barrel protein, partial [Planctomycetota bacterium]|nr:TIM barrel protein [Planctomycetota bacterium]